jgi:hypothetical protein
VAALEQTLSQLVQRAVFIAVMVVANAGVAFAGARAPAQDNSSMIQVAPLVKHLQKKGIPAKSVVLELSPELPNDERPQTIRFMRNYDVTVYRARIELESGSFLNCSRFEVYSKPGAPIEILKTIGTCAF